VNGELQFIGKTHVTILHDVTRIRIARPYDLVNRIHILQKCSDTFEPVRELRGNRQEVNPTTLLEIGELCDLESVEHHLPSNAPRAQRGSLPVILFELDIVLSQINADRSQRLEIQFLHV